MKLTCCQMDITWEDKAANFARVESLLTQGLADTGDDAPAASGGPGRGGMVILPEMFATGFSSAVERIAEPEDGPTTRFLRAMARRHDCVMVGGVVRRGTDGKGRNRALAVDPGGRILGDYAKIHPFSYGQESEHYGRGDDLVLFDWQGVCTGLAICYDLRFAELFRALTRRGAQLLIVLANWPAARAHHWRTLLLARAIENQCYVAACNRVGCDPKNEYAGDSLIIDPRGRVLADAGAREMPLRANLDLEELQRYRLEFPVLRDFRDDLFAG